MRDYYEICQVEWVEGVKRAKEDAEAQGRPFPELYPEGQKEGIYPQTPQVDPEFLRIQEEKLELVSAYLSGSEAPSAVADQLAWVCGKELGI